MSALPWLLVAVPLCSGALLAAAGRRADRLAPVLGPALAAVTLVLAGTAAAVRPSAGAPLLAGVRAGLAVDGLSAVMVVTVASVMLCVLVFSATEFGPEEARGRFHGLMLFFGGAMLLTVTATTLPLLLMAWEAMGASSWALIGYWWRQPARVRAADTAFLATRSADLGLYLAAGAALAGGAGGLELAELPAAASPWVHVAAGGVAAAALGKSAQLPLSFWLSRAMQGPSPVSALLHSATMVAAGAYLLLRLHPLLAATSWAGPLVAWTGALTALLLGAVALAQRDLKQLLAASTCAQIGYMVLAAGSGAVAGGVTQLVAHAAAKSALFLAAGAWLTALGTKQLPALRGAARRYRAVGTAFVVCALTLAGLPPLSLWAAKDEVLAGARAESAGLYAVGLAGAALAAAYSVKAVWYVTRPRPARAAEGYDTEQRGTRHVGRSAPQPLAVLTAAAAVLGVLALPGPAAWLKRLVGSPAEPSPTAWELVLSGALAAAVAAAAWWWGNRPGALPAAPRWAREWLYLERAADALVVRPVLALARSLAAFDDRVVDGAVRAAARGGLAAARTARRVDDDGVDAAVRAVAAGTGRLGRWARRPQTGLLHQYYAQAAVGFAVLALIVLLAR
ncbi:MULTISPECIES: proton-conducting transporter membrane subunit [unclassified Streptomyces]|uniref:proton-conducting transporter transmembrane domain-containing protein n=1 Tax=unclassified Streptomyces TaxID=2593676 RepID=UPI0034297452